MESGLPKPTNYKDEPYKWSEGFYKMDKEKLEKRLNISKLIIGDVEKQLDLFSDYNPAPIDVLCLTWIYTLQQNQHLNYLMEMINFLPRLMCYFDDIGSIEFLRDWFKEFNDQNITKKIGQNLKLKFNTKVR